MYLKSTLAMLATLTLLAASATPAAALDQAPDGITASITFEDSLGDLVLVADENGDYTASVSIFQADDGEWEQIQLWATLRVFEDSLFGGIDRVSIPFQSSADGPVSITFSGEEFTGGSLDVFVTFSQLGVNPETGTVPTSHHHLVKNLAIEQGDFDLADGFDHHNTRLVGL